uniref:Uncharacterized protein n=1 Tax=Cucumis melo TaxID=3656 RepID=A0A9I9E9N9_CUCME
MPKKKKEKQRAKSALPRGSLAEASIDGNPQSTTELVHQLLGTVSADLCVLSVDFDLIIFLRKQQMFWEKKDGRE